MAAADILVSGGVAAVLASVVGGGLKAFSVELPLLATVRRQMLVLVVGVALIGLGMANDGFKSLWQKQPADPQKLLKAAHDGDVESVRRNLTSETSNARTIDKMNALMVAADACRMDVAQAILSSGTPNMDINAENIYGDSALSIADGTPMELKPAYKPRCPQMVPYLKSIGARYGSGVPGGK